MQYVHSKYRLSQLGASHSLTVIIYYKVDA